MKKHGISRAALLAVAFLLITPLMAFTLRGGEGFEIYLSKKLILQQFLNIDQAVKTVDLSTAVATDELNVSYNHCGQTGTSRVISLKDKNPGVERMEVCRYKPGWCDKDAHTGERAFSDSKERERKTVDPVLYVRFIKGRKNAGGVDDRYNSSEYEVDM